MESSILLRIHVVPVRVRPRPSICGPCGSVGIKEGGRTNEDFGRFAMERANTKREPRPPSASARPSWRRGEDFFDGGSFPFSLPTEREGERERRGRSRK